MQLFYAPNTISVAVAIALQEAGLPYDLKRLDFAQGEQTSTAYLAVNPKGRVPALLVGDEILTETGALLDYVAALAPDANLVPSDPIEAAKMRSVMYYLASTMHINHAHKMRGHRWADETSSHEDMTHKVPQTMAASAQYIEDECLAWPFVLGDALSLADIYLFTICTWLEGDGVDVAQYPKLTALMSAMEARPSVQQVRALGILT